MTMLHYPQYECEFDAETQEFYDGVVDMFTGIREGHIGRYCFSSARSDNDRVRGDEHWTRFIKTSAAYYPYRHEIEIIRHAASHIGKLVSDAHTFIDLGTGSLNSFERKVLPIIRAGKFKEITFVDLCTAFSEIATARLKEELADIKTNTFLGNFFNSLPMPQSKAAINLFGITLGNIVVDLPNETPEYALTRTMKHFAAPLKEKGGYFIFDYDTNEDESSLHASYEHPSYHAMELTILDRVKRDLPTSNFDPDDFEHVTVWHQRWKLLAHGVRAKTDLKFSIGPYQIDVPRGKFYRTGSSFKYSDVTIEQVAENAGFRKLQVFSMPGSTMRVAVYAMRP
ncbi:MAG: L-histidine N(alpha)-methyltransferase [Candidatus Obscuribacterales bacterium]|nr:L-histidine N(alpha)-methyltransferase [Candidatus Obscuribacterales bacterium]